MLSPLSIQGQPKQGAITRVQKAEQGKAVSSRGSQIRLVRVPYSEMCTTIQERDITSSTSAIISHIRSRIYSHGLGIDVNIKIILYTYGRSGPS